MSTVAYLFFKKKNNYINPARSLFPPGVYVFCFVIVLFLMTPVAYSQSYTGGAANGGIMGITGLISFDPGNTTPQLSRSTGGIKDGYDINDSESYLDGTSTTGFMKMRGGSFDGHDLFLYSGILQYSGLPVELISFTGSAHSNTAHLQWITGSEVNVWQFVLERALPGKPFKAITSANALYPHGGLYKHDDKHLDSGLHYYRLHIIDFDGRSEYSNVIPVNISKGDSRIRLIPNPAKDYVLIDLAGITDIQSVVVDIINTAGMLMGSQIIHSDPLKGITVEITDLPAGVYFFVIKTGSQSFREKCFKLN